MATTTSNTRRPHLTYRPDQQAVPAVTRSADLLRLAQTIADLTHPCQRVVLEPEDRLMLAMALPNLPDEHARAMLTTIIGELHAAEQAERLDPRGRGYVPPETYRDSAAESARAAVEADLKAGTR